MHFVVRWRAQQHTPRAGEGALPLGRMPKRPDKLVVENPLNDQDFGGKDMAAALRTLSPGKTTSMVRSLSNIFKFVVTP